MPPKARKIPHPIDVHGHLRTDDYFWLNDREDPHVIAYLEAENAYTEATMRPWRGLNELLVREMKTRICEVDVSAPFQDGDYFYYYRYEKGHEYPIYCRKFASMDAAEQVLLDVNVLAEGYDYFSVRSFTVAPDHRTAAFAVDTAGRKFYTLRFLDLESGQFLVDEIADVSSNCEWANDSKTLLYTRQDADTLREFQVRRYTVGEKEDSLVYQEDDEANTLWTEKSLCGNYLFLVSAATLSTEIRYLPADAPGEPPVLFLGRQPDHEYYVTEGGDRFYILTNDGAVNFRLMQAPFDDIRRESWTEVVGHRDDVLIEGIDVFDTHVVLCLLQNGLAEVEIVDRGTGQVRRIEFDEPIYTVFSGDNYRYDSEWFRYTYESLTTPESTYDFNLRTGERQLIREQQIPGGFSKENYRAERLFVPARDGAMVPVSMVYRRGMRRHGGNPFLLWGYGSYGISIEPEFDADRLSLLDRGFIFAIAHIRGGAELGRQWYYDGRQSSKKNTFFDFIDVTKYLMDKGYTSPEHMYARGGSAGGLLMGAVANMAPELYHGIATRVPFVDVVTTMLDASIPLTTYEWDEWGNPADKASYEYILSYSPYDNVERKAYPHMLVTTGLHDSQVQYWEPAKWVAKLREYKTDDNLLMLQVDMQAGHTGKTGRYQSLEDTALYYTFFLTLEGFEA